MRRFRPAAVIAALLLTLTAAPAATVDRADMDTLLSKHFRADGPGAVVVVLKDGKVVFLKAYGMADLAAGTPMDVERVFRIASVTKTFTAAATLLLVDDFKIDLRSSIRRYLPDLPEAWKPVTVEQLLAQTSGIYSYTDDPGWWGRQGEDLTPAQLLDTYAKPRPLVFTPGSRWQYSNSGYLLLGMIIEAVSKQPYAEFLKKRIFDPLGMSSTAYGADDDKVPALARGYGPGNRPAPFVSKVQLFSTAGLVSTAEDLGKWLTALRTGKVLKPASLERMLTMVKTSEGKETGYGLGLYLRTSQGHRLANHGGQILGYESCVEMDLDGKVDVVVLTNSSPPPVRPEFLTRRLIALANGNPLDDPVPVTVSPAKLARLAGKYRTDRGIIRFSSAEGRLWRWKGPEKTELIPLSDTLFGLPGSDTRFRFQVTADGVAGFVAQPAGGPETELAPRIGDYTEPVAVKVDPALFDAYAGSYELEPGVVLKYWRDGDRFMTQGPGEPPGELLPESPTVFFIPGLDVKIEFVRNADGTIKEVVILREERRITARRLP